VVVVRWRIDSFRISLQYVPVETYIRRKLLLPVCHFRMHKIFMREQALSNFYTYYIDSMHLRKRLLSFIHVERNIYVTRWKELKNSAYFSVTRGRPKIWLIFPPVRNSYLILKLLFLG